MKFYLTLIASLYITLLSAQDFRNLNWLDSKEEVKTKENAYFLEEFSKSNYVDEMHYVQFDSGFAFHLYYVFRKNQLIGVKTQRLRLSGQNSKYSALEAYKNLYQTYEEKYGKERLRERNGTEQAVKILEVKLADKELFVTVEKKGSEYCLVENIFKIN